MDEPSPAHNVFDFDGVVFSSNFDNGNLARVEKASPGKAYDFRIWTALDNLGTPHQSKHCGWFHFQVHGVPQGTTLRINIANASNHSSLYKHDMRPVFRSNSTNQKWTRIRNSVKFIRSEDESSNTGGNGSVAQLTFEHTMDCDNDRVSFAFTYPYSYTQLQSELTALDTYENDFSGRDKDAVIYYRELLTESCSGRRIDLLTITSAEGVDQSHREPLLSGLFPTNQATSRPFEFPNKEVIFVSARVHPGEVPAQHTWKGMFNLLMDKNDLRAKELRRRYVIKMIPMLNPDGVYHGHFRMDQYGQNLNRYYSDPNTSRQPAIYAAKTLLDYYAHDKKQLCLYIDLHAHASKRGCFIYGNVLDSLDDQVQNQLFCKLISLNSAHFDYEGCLFSKEHMVRIDPGDAASGLTAEGSGRVATYLAHGLVHSYTLECNYNTSKVANEIAPTDGDPGGQCVTAASPYTTLPEKYTPATWAGVGRACLVAILDLRGHNPCSRIPKSRHKTLDRVRQTVLSEVRIRKEYKGQSTNSIRRPKSTDVVAGSSSNSHSSGAAASSVAVNCNNDNFEAYFWRRTLHDPAYKGPLLPPPALPADDPQSATDNSTISNKRGTTNTKKVTKVAVKMTSAYPEWPADLCSKALSDPVPLPLPDNVLLGNQALANHSAMYARAAYKLSEELLGGEDLAALAAAGPVVVKPLGGGSSSKSLFSRVVDDPVGGLMPKPSMLSTNNDHATAQGIATSRHRSNNFSSTASRGNHDGSSSADSAGAVVGRRGTGSIHGTPRRPSDPSVAVGSRIPRISRSHTNSPSPSPKPSPRQSSRSPVLGQQQPNDSSNCSNQASGNSAPRSVPIINGIASSPAGIDPRAAKFKATIAGMMASSGQPQSQPFGRQAVLQNNNQQPAIVVYAPTPPAGYNGSINRDAAKIDANSHSHNHINGSTVVSNDELESLANLVVNAAIEYSQNVTNNTLAIESKLPKLALPQLRTGGNSSSGTIMQSSALVSAGLNLTGNGTGSAAGLTGLPVQNSRS